MDSKDHKDLVLSNLQAMLNKMDSLNTHPQNSLTL